MEQAASYDGCSDYTYPANTVLFAASPADIDLAKNFIKHHGLTAEDVKILKNEKTITVVAKKDVLLSLVPWEIKGETK